MSKMEEFDGLFDDHPSLGASLRDFEPSASEILEHSPPFGSLYLSRHSHQSHGYRSETDSDSDMADSVHSAGGYSPPAWRRTRDGSRSSGFWNRNLGASAMRSRQSVDHDYDSVDEDDETLAIATRTKLPTGSLSPEKRWSQSPYPTGGGEYSSKFDKIKEESPQSEERKFTTTATATTTTPGTPVDDSKNYIRLGFKAEVQHRTEPIEVVYTWCKKRFTSVTKSWSSLFRTLGLISLCVWSFQTAIKPGPPLPVPDLVKVAGLARAFEPLIFYSENGVTQIGDLQATGVAVWDLGESVRSTNMTSAPIIVKELDELSESLKTLSLELTKFFANVDGDVDGILIVMDWAKRELSQISSVPPSHLTSALTNLHTLLSTIGILESSNGEPTRLGLLTTSLFGHTLAQRTHKTLQRTFNEFLAVLEESINNELTYSQALFSLFENIDRQFLNLARTVIRESDQQERLESDLLSSLWTRVLGSNSADLRKFEKNKLLLSNVREKTVRNKHILVDHNGKLMTLKANLEILRKKLVSPLVRSEVGSTIGVQEQIRGLEGVHGHLWGVRERQKGKLMEMLYGSGARRRVIIGREGEGEERWEIEGRR